MSLAGSSIPTHEEIRTVVTDFYAKTRAHPALGPIFADHVADWKPHEEKIFRFWCGALLRERGYSGNPLQRHLAARNVTSDHFPAWLNLFDSVLAANLPDKKAILWSTLAHRIGKSLSFGLEYAGRKTVDTPPKLSSFSSSQ
jgi:hemoglobin